MWANSPTGIEPSELIVACVLKSGGEYDVEYVERLYRGVTKHLSIPHRFVCLSDVDVPCERIELKYNYPGWWSKMELFRPDIKGDIFYLDLDTVIVGNLAPLVLMGDPKMFYGGVSSIMCLPHWCRSRVWEKWIKNPEEHMEKLGYSSGRRRVFMGMFDKTNIGDQALIRKSMIYSEFPKGYLRWYDEFASPVCNGPGVLNPSVAPDPKKLAAIMFNYKPRPRDVGWLENGITVGKLRYGTG